MYTVPVALASQNRISNGNGTDCVIGKRTLICEQLEILASYIVELET